MSTTLEQTLEEWAERPEEYAWSSYREDPGLREAAAWLDCQTVVRELGGTLEHCRSAYRRFVEAGIATAGPSLLAGAGVEWLLGFAVYLASLDR